MDAERNAGPMVKQTRYLKEMGQSHVGLHSQIKSHSHQKVAFSERVRMHHNAGGIADDLEDEAAEHATKEPPYAVSNTQHDLSDQA
jgi:hypothetical protein